jgi:dual specificity tyrosine-phosphorylation-regulated kinase 2/3/4
MLGIPFTTAIDMWSFGCILIELYIGIPIFPGESESEQLALLMEVIGLPDMHLLEVSARR